MGTVIRLKSLLNGFLLTSMVEKIENSRLLSAPNFYFKEKIKGVNGWDSFVLESKEPLKGEDEAELPGPYIYPVLSRISGSRILLLCQGKQVLDKVIEVLSETYQPKLVPIRFHIHKMVCDIAAKPQNHVLTAVHTRVDAYGSNLKSASFYGDDIGEATLFRNNIELFSCFSCGVKEVGRKYELIRLSSDGVISFRLYNFRELQNIEKILNYVAENGYYIVPEGYSQYEE